MKRPLFVFAGQSNMMGAASLPASEQIFLDNSFEYMHKAKRFNGKTGTFRNYGFPCGEFSYKNLEEAYGPGADENSISSLDNYQNTTYFCPSMCIAEDLEKKTHCTYEVFSEANNRMAASLPPFIAKELEKAGYACAYVNISKGSAPIDYYVKGEAADYFDKKVTDFFEDSKVQFPNDDMSEKVFVWLQGESDALNGYEYYKNALVTLWNKLKSVGFTKFFMVRVGFWGNEKIADVMRAQEDFCTENDGAFMITRVCSFFEWFGYDSDTWLPKDMPEEFTACRDSFHGFNNQHINEKGFKVIAKYAVPNIIRILFDGKAPALEEEKVLPLIK